MVARKPEEERPEDDQGERPSGGEFGADRLTNREEARLHASEEERDPEDDHTAPEQELKEVGR